MKSIYQKKNNISTIRQKIQQEINTQVKSRINEAVLSFKKKNKLYVDFTLFAKGKITNFAPTTETIFLKMHKTALLTNQTMSFQIKIHKTDIKITTLLYNPFIRIQTPIDEQ